MTRLPTRRRFVTTTMADDGVCRPRRHQTGLSRSRRRPLRHLPWRPVGRLSSNSGVVWARVDRPARMLVEWSTTESLKSVQHGGFVDALPETDYTAKMLLA